VGLFVSPMKWVCLSVQWSGFVCQSYGVGLFVSPIKVVDFRKWYVFSPIDGVSLEVLVFSHMKVVLEGVGCQ